MYYDENNNYFEVDSYDKINNVEIGNIIFNRHMDSIIDIVEGFNKGNLFNNLYSKYKNHVYKLKVNNKKDELLYKIQVYNFAIKDISLYLDIHPTETNMIRKYKELNRELKKHIELYQKEYSPIDINDVESDSKWTWVNNPWPWDKGGNI